MRELMWGYILLCDKDESSLKQALYLPKDGRRIQVNLSMYITSRNNLVAEFHTHDEEVNEAVAQDKIFGHYQPHRLFQLSHFWDMRQSVPYWTQWPQNERNPAAFKQCEQLWTTFTEFVPVAVQAFLDKVAKLVDVHGQSARLCNVPLSSHNAYPSVALISELEYSPHRHPLEEITGISQRDLYSQVPRPKAGANMAALEEWRSLVVAVGGKDPASTAGWEQVALEFFWQHDYVAKEQARLANIERKKAEKAQRLATARELLANLPAKSQIGWSKSFAEQLGIPTTSVRRWIVRNLPDIAATVYPPKAAKA
jgi:hypothetical protein